MQNKPTVFVVCGVFNHLEYTKRLLKCLEEQTYSNIRIFIVDDGSTDGTAEYIHQKYPKITFLKGDGNLWWTGSLYWGIEEILKVAQEDDFILTINNDCTFGKSYVGILLNTSKKNDRAIVGSLVIDEKDRASIVDAGTKIDWKNGKFIYLISKKVTDLPEDKVIDDKVDVLSTRGTLFPLEVFKKIGNFDQKHFPHYMSDYEFALRAKTSGFELVMSYEARVYNDARRTGLGKNKTRGFRLAVIWNLLFSRRSRLNIIDNIRFIRYCCPKEYKVRNYLFLLKKIVGSGYHFLYP